MGYKEKSKQQNYRAGFLVLLFLVLSSGIAAAVFFTTDYPARHQTKKLAGNHMPCVPLQAPSIKDTVTFLTLSQEIALLNQDTVVAFEKEFASGSSNARSLTDYLLKTHSGFVLNLKETSFLTTPTLHDSLLYVSGGFAAKAFHCFHATTGKAVWSVDLSDDGPSSSLVIDSLLIFNTESCTLFVLDRFTGKQIWSKWIGDPLLTHPVADGKNIYTAYPGMNLANHSGQSARFRQLSPSHAFAAFDAKTGKIKWQRWLDGDIMTTPVLDGKHIYLNTFKGTLYKLDKATGRILAVAKLNMTSLPCIGQQKVYGTQRKIVKGVISEALISLDKNDFSGLRTLAIQAASYLDDQVQEATDYKGICRQLDAANGFDGPPDRSGWKNARDLIGLSNVSALQNFVGSTVVLSGNELYSTFGNRIIALDKNSGKTIWSYPLPKDAAKVGGHAATMPLVAGNRIVTVTLDGAVLLLNRISGKAEKSFPLGTAVRNQPIVVYGTIYVTTTNGKIICIRTNDPSLTGWPMLLRNNNHNTNG